MKRLTSNETSGPCKPKMRQMTLVSIEKPSQSINEELWETTVSLLVYTHPKCEPSSKILGLDMDGTVIVTSSGKVFPKDYTDWKLINDNVVPKLKEYFDKGYKVVLLSNQRGITKGYQDISSFKIKIQNIVDKLNIPIQGLFSILDDKNRKPLTGMWDYLNDKGNAGIPIDLSSSVYCGDAAGRSTVGKRKHDHSCADRLFAQNVGIRFLTPEQLWFDRLDTDKFEMPKFNPTELLTIDHEQNSKLPIIGKPIKPELILMVGYPAAGKSYFCSQVLMPLGYKVISRDNVGSWQKCVQAVEQAISKSLSVVVDNTNMDLESRTRYIKIAKVWDIPVRCFIMETSIEHAQHNERFRVLTNSSHKPISQMVYNMMKSKYITPTMEEGYQEIVTIPFILDKNMENLSLYYRHDNGKRPSKENSYSFSIDQPLASSTQQPDTDVVMVQSTNNNTILKKINKDNIESFYETQEWYLKYFSRYCEQSEQQCNQVSSNEQNNPKTLMSKHQQDETMEREQQQQNAWETWTEETDIKLKIRLAGFGHLCILRGKMILESYFLIMSKKWMKAVIVGGYEMMIQIKQSNRIKRFRMTFLNETDAMDCFMNLSKFATTTNTVGNHNHNNNNNNNNNHDNSTLLNNNEYMKNENNTSTETILNNMLNHSIQLPESWSTEWPTQSLEGLIRLCLIDPNFPGFVNHIDNIMKKFTCTMTD
ncbi:unnamed protein product [Schistosoma turkestanicum]|nr:unnamed protein product [Schistosoma turkestanicum]